MIVSMYALSRIIVNGFSEKKDLRTRSSEVAFCRIYSLVFVAFDVAIKAGALSGKVSGAGGGGFIMFFEGEEIISSTVAETTEAV